MARIDAEYANGAQAIAVIEKRRTAWVDEEDTIILLDDRAMLMPKHDNVRNIGFAVSRGVPCLP